MKKYSVSKQVGSVMIKLGQIIVICALALNVDRSKELATLLLGVGVGVLTAFAGFLLGELEELEAEIFGTLVVLGAKMYTKSKNPGRKLTICHELQSKFGDNTYERARVRYMQYVREIHK